MTERQEHDLPLADEHEVVHHEAIHLPGPSYWPIFLSVCLVITLAGLLIHPIVSVVGAVASIGAIIAWGLEDPNQ